MIIGEPTYSEADFLTAIPTNGTACNTAHIMAQVGCARNTAMVWLERLVARGKIEKVNVLGGSPVWKRAEGKKTIDQEDANHKNLSEPELPKSESELPENKVARALKYFSITLERCPVEKAKRALFAPMINVLRCVDENASISELDTQLAEFDRELSNVYYNRVGGYVQDELLRSYMDAGLTPPNRQNV